MSEPDIPQWGTGVPATVAHAHMVSCLCLAERKPCSYHEGHADAEELTTNTKETDMTILETEPTQACTQPPPRFSIPARTDSTWALLQLWQDSAVGPIVWWRLASGGRPHSDDPFGVEMIDSNREYRRAVVHDADLKTLSTLRDHVANIASAPTWKMDANVTAWLADQEPSSRLIHAPL